MRKWGKVFEYGREWVEDLESYDLGKYTGFVNEKGKPHGLGKHFNGYNKIYEGQWRNGEFDGFGRMITQGGHYYTGQWAKGQYHGKGS
mmetsp:Transcript_19769/g.30497  ORF Transcript_19769/g.30497 Transcript_19769/m.30497 type:complete len:88 (+) Transcript_19769:140-403(+)